MDSYLGLTQVEVSENQARFGPNLIEKKRRTPFLFRFLRKAANPLLLILLFSGILSAFLGQKTDFIIILIILLISVILDALQENQAESAAEKLAQKITLKAKVIRDGRTVEINTASVTVGDLVLLMAGNIIPADGRLLKSENLEVNESALTGETFPQDKKSGDFIFMGTHVVSGSALARITAIGRSTQLGDISRSLSNPRPQTEFEKGLDNFSLLLVRLTFVFSVALFLINLILGHQLISSLMFVLALAIGFAPELLPMILTVNLAKGSLRLSRKGVIVKFLPAIENFGSIDVLCTDKTGTLTEGNMVLETYLNTTGVEDMDVLKQAYLNSYFQASFRNPTDEAILKEKIELPAGIRKVGEIAYDFYRRRSTVIVENQNKTLLITKGAVDSVLPLCRNRDQIKINFDSLNCQGYRTILLAAKEVKTRKKYSSVDETGLDCLGVLVLTDPPKKAVAETINRLKSLGIGLKILTGDNSQVARHVCSAIGLEVSGVLSGQQIEKMTDERLGRLVDTTTIFASINPDQKLKIINVLKQKGRVVGYMGDGINDAPSLRNADIGISVNNAVDVAKESADLILLHKDLKILLDGVEEGRTTFANLMKYILMGTSSTFGNMISLSFASILLPFMPMLPVQLLLNDLMYDFSQMLLVKDNVDRSVISRPYHWRIESIRNFMLVFGGLSSVFDILTFYILYIILKASPSVFQTGWFMESFLSQMMIIFSIRTALVPFWRSRVSLVFAAGIVLITLLTLSMPYTFLAPYFHFNPPSLVFLSLLIAIVCLYIALVEFVKERFYK